MKTQRDEFDAQLTEKKQHLDEINAKLLDAENKVRAVAHKYTTDGLKLSCCGFLKISYFLEQILLELRIENCSLDS